MKVYHLFLSGLMMNGVAISQTIPLASESQKKMAISALKGSLTMVGIYTAGYALFNDFTLPSLSEHQKTYAILSALGAITMGLWRYNYVPERYYDYAQYELEKISHNKLILLALSVRGDDFIDQIKTLYVRESFPLVRAFKQMNAFYSRLQEIDEYLDEVLRSSRTDLYGSCYEMQIMVQTIQNALEVGLKTIKEEAHFINEYNAQTSLAMQQAQSALAHAAHSQAAATWVNALKN